MTRPIIKILGDTTILRKNPSTLKKERIKAYEYQEIFPRLKEVQIIPKRELMNYYYPMKGQSIEGRPLYIKREII